MVTYIRSDLDFILAQIKIAEDHALYEQTGGAQGKPLFGPNGSVPAYNVSWGLRTVDGTYNNLLHPEWGAADNEFPEPLGTQFRTIMVDPDGDGPMGPVPVTYQPGVDNDGPFGPADPSDVFDPTVRTISNLLVDQTLGNPSAILTALQRAGIVAPEDQMDVTGQISVAYEPLKPLFNTLAAAERADAAAQAAASASPLNQALQDAAAATAAAVVTAQANLDAQSGPLMTLLAASGVELDGSNIVITNTAPDEGLSAPFNSWFTLFGQFFDHGLDLVAKGGNGTVFIPLMEDDPLFVPGGQTNFMVLTRATIAGPGPDGILGNGDDTNRPVNNTTSFVDQNQTYTSHPSHQVFLRQYVLSVDSNNDGIMDSHPVATGKLIEGADGGMATWGDVKAQAKNILGIDLTDYHVGNLPLLATDPYGNFIPNPTTGFPQVVMAGPPQTLASGTPAAPLALVTIAADGADEDLAPDVTHLAVRTGHAFLADIAHNAVPEGKIDDGDTEIGLANPGNGDLEYDDELLDAHFIAGDGRANENIGLTAVHHIFHSEHNRLLQHTKDVVLASNDLAFINEWLVTDLPNLAAIPTTPEGLAALNWDGERLFQAAKFGTEMQYQHLVFEEFARKIQPNINVFLVPDGFDVTIDPSIVAEFAHVVYRFGHSMLTESIDRFDPTFTENHIGLIEGFLNPLQFRNNGTDAAVDDDIAAGAIVRGMTRQAGNEIDEFVTSALRNNLLGLPLDLATINLARGRDTGVPSLNEARRQFYEATNHDVLLKPYESWVDFAGHLKHEASIINFVAAYGTHALITGQTTLEGKRDAAMTLIFNQSFGGLAVQADAADFLNATGAYAPDGAGTNDDSRGGLNNVDLWIGGLAEAIMPFGGMLGSTFNFVFEMQMEKLQNGDRFYYLQRLDGLHLFGEMENNSFAAMIMRNTDATHLPSDVFSTPGLILEVDQTKQFNDLDGDGTLESTDPVGGGILTQLVIRNDPSTAGTDTHYLRYTGGDHVVLGGTEANNTLIAGIGDDTLFGDGGNDRLEGGFGNDIINGGAGDDIIVDSGGDDNIKGEDGNDVVHAGPGLDLVMGGRGQDFIFLGTDMGSEVFAGEGNDFIYGNKNAERILGNEGNDWIETGTFDGAPGDNFDEVFAQDGVDGHDVFLGDGGFDEFIAEGGDDIMVGSPGRGKMAGMSGWDWATYKDNSFGVDADFTRGIVFDENPNPPQNGTLDAYEGVEGLSGSAHNDLLTGSDIIAEERLPFAQGGSEGYRGSQLTKEGLALIAGLREVLGLTEAQVNAMAAGTVVYNAGEIILGGDGSDTIMGRGGDDIIDGDKWLDVQIGVFATTDPDHTGAPIALHNSMTTLANSMFNGSINPGQLGIVRTIRTDTTAGDIDVARYQGGRGEYAFSATADGQVIISHVVADALDGTDRLRNIEKAQFATGNALNIIVGTPGNDTGATALNGTADDDLILGLAGTDTLNGLAGDDILVGGPGIASLNYVDNFEAPSQGNSNGTTTWDPDWSESGDSGGITTGQIRIDAGNNNVLQFLGGTGGDFNGAQIQRTVPLAGATGATLNYSVLATGLDGAPDNDAVTVFFSRDGSTFVQVDVINSASVNTPRSIDLSLFGTGPFTANAALRFVATSLETGDSVNIDGLTINATGSFGGTDTLNGGAGNDTYSFALGDGNDVINELANEGTLDRISILAPATGVDGDGLPILTLNSLSMADDDNDNNDGSLIITYGMPNGAQTVTQQITVNNHFDGTNAQSGVERINFNGAVYAGYALGTEDYLISRDDGGADLSATTTNNVIVGESGGDTIIGGAGNDLIFGAAGDNNLTGGDGDDLIVGGAGNGDDDQIDGGLGADTMIGLGGDDEYIVDDLLDVVVEAAGAGTDEVFTEMAALSIELMANVENLTYTGVDADQFVGTGNAGNNVISGGDLADTLSGLGGNDTLQGGLGADTMIGGDGNDVYEVDEAGDVVTEANADAVTGGTDRVESDIDYTLGANVENLDLNGTAVRGTGNILNNVINGNDENNQLFGAGGNDTLTGDDGNDLLDGGDGNDTISGGNDNDTIIGGAGDDTIDVGGGFNTIVYNAPGFGADTINSFDADGGAATNQDKIDLSALGVTTTNFAARVVETAVTGPAGRLLTVNDGAGNVLGTIRINNVTDAQIDINDFTLAAPAPTSTITGTDAANTLNGVGTTSETINALSGNDTVNANGGNDVVNGGEGADTLNGGDGNDTLSGGVGITNLNYVDNFEAPSQGNSNGTTTWDPDWSESGDSGGITTGQIRIDAGNNNVLQFLGGTGGDFNGAQIQRTVPLAGATGATLNYSVLATGLDGAPDNDAVTVFFSRDGSTFVQVDVINSASVNTPRSIDLSLFGTGPFTANAALRFVATSLETGDSVNIDGLTINATGSFGVDTVNGNAGDDTIIWNANAAAPTDGRDIVNGGTEGAVGDTFVINGNASAEAYTIYTRAAWLAVAGNVAGSLNAATEIVVTRNGSDNAAVIAELSEIEEVRINGVDPSGTGGTFGGDTFAVVGDFSSTSLRLNTITIDGDPGDDTIDISALSSAHRIVFRSNGGHDTIVGTLRPQDVIELPDGAAPADYDSTTDANGVTTMSNGTHSIRFTAPNGPPQVGGDDDDDDDDHHGGDDDDDDDDDHHGGHDDDDDDDHHGGDDDDDDDCGCDDDDDEDGPGAQPTGSLRVGTAQGDVLIGTAEANDMIGLAGDDVLVGGDGADNISAGEGNDFVNAGAGADVVFAGSGDDQAFGGAGADMLYGEAGDDKLFGEGGDDLIDAGAGNDTVVAGGGDDRIAGAVGDGDDTYFGDNIGGGNGTDTLDLSAITANLTVDLGNGLLGRGSASSSQSGTDTLWSIENVATGSGSDTITASNALNVIEGGAGDDTFRFLSAEGADGDTILDFEPGDRLDLSGIDADSGLAGNQSFTLVNGPLTGAGQVAVSYEIRTDGEYTIVSGSLDANADEEFRIDLKGNHTLTGSNFTL